MLAFSGERRKCRVSQASAQLKDFYVCTVWWVVGAVISAAIKDVEKCLDAAWSECVLSFGN